MMSESNDASRALDAATIDAVKSEVADAKARGWLQNDLKRHFSSLGLETGAYGVAVAGGVVSQSTAAALAQVSITGLPDKPRTTNREDIRRHIEWLIEPALGDYGDALFEIAYDVPPGGCNGAKLFDFSEIEEAVAFAADKSDSGVNVYIAAALKLPDTPRNGRARGEYFYAATAVPIDIDEDYDATRAAMAAVCDDGLVVTTGLVPERRSQHWARLLEPADSEADFVHAFAALVVHTGADFKVKDGARIMRLGGTVAYPHDRKQAKGYCTETTSVAIKADARPTDIERLKGLEPAPAARLAQTERQGGPSGEIVRDWTGRVVDGRESEFRNMLLRHLADYQESTGCDPTPQEIFDAAFVEFSDPRRVDNKDGRWTSPAGQQQLMARATNTIRRLETGRLAKVGLFSVNTGVGEAEATARKAEREARFREENAPATITEYRAQQAEEQPSHQSGQPPVISATPYAWIDASRIPPRDVLYGRHYFRQFLSATVSPGGLGKSSNAVVEALAMVTGRDLLGDMPSKPMSVWYWNGEDPMEELQRRVAAACLHYKIKAEDLGSRLYVDSGRDHEIVIARETRGDISVAFPLVDGLVKEIQRRGIDVLIIDPFVASHAVSENDNTKIEAVVRQWMRVAEEGRCAIELVHHTRKTNGQNETTVDDARGAGALLAKARSARVLNAMTKTEASEVGVEEKERFGFFRIDNGKANLAPRGEYSAWRRMIGVPLGNRIDANEDEVGVPIQWIKPDMFADLKDADRVAVVRAVQSGSWREDVRASNWVGQAVAGAMGLDLDDDAERNKVKKLVGLWTRTGVFKIVQGQDERRRVKAFVIAPDIE